jgi:hypothetical protein
VRGQRVSARALFWQGLLIVAALALVTYLVGNAQSNLAKLSGCETSLARSTTSSALGRTQGSGGG